MKTTLALPLCLCLSLTVLGQEAKKAVDESMKTNVIAADTSKKGPWKFGGTFTLNLTQQNSSYWTGVTEKYAFGLGAAADLYGNYASGKHSWDNTLKGNYAFQNNESQGVRKTNDFVDFYSKYGRNINEKKTLSLAAIFNLRTQFSDGFDYNQDPKRRTSGFFAPANILLTPGLDWKPAPYFSLFVSPVAGKWIIVSNDPYSYSYPGGVIPGGGQQEPISKLYGVDPEDKVDAQFGAFLSANFNKEIMKNVSYTSRFDLYANYKRNPQNMDVFWTNRLTFKANKFLGVSYLWNLAYDDDYSPEGVNGPRMQFLGSLGISFIAKF